MTWVWIEILVALALVARHFVGVIDAYEMVRHFRRDYQQLIPLAELDTSCRALSLEFREVSYFTYPAPGQKRQWVDALVRVVVAAQSTYWTSDELKLGQVNKPTWW